MHRNVFYFFIIIFALTGCVNSSASPKSTKEITISAAASLSDAMHEIAQQFTKKTGVKVNVNLASSGTLEKQIEEGAPADLFISASKDYVDELVQKGLVNEKDVQPLLSNQLVLIVPKDSQIKSINDLTSAKRIAIGTPEIVPAGLYAKESLQNLKLWPTVEPKLIYGKDVRQVLSYVETGNVDAGFVYKSDALISSKVKIVSVMPAESHAPIIYPCAVIKKSANKNAVKKFYSYLQSDEAGQIFKNFGFEPMKKD